MGYIITLFYSKGDFLPPENKEKTAYEMLKKLYIIHNYIFAKAY